MCERTVCYVLRVLSPVRLRDRRGLSWSRGLDAVDLEAWHPLAPSWGLRFAAADRYGWMLDVVLPL